MVANADNEDAPPLQVRPGKAVTDVYCGLVPAVSVAVAVLVQVPLEPVTV